MAAAIQPPQSGFCKSLTKEHNRRLDNPVWKTVDLESLLENLNVSTKNYIRNEGEHTKLNTHIRRIIVNDCEKIIPKMIKDLVIRISQELPEEEKRKLNKLERPDYPQLFYSKFNPRDKIDLTPETEPKTYQVVKTLGNPQHVKFVDYIFINAQAYRLHIDENNDEHNIPFQRFVSYVTAHKKLTDELTTARKRHISYCKIALPFIIVAGALIASALYS
ncbi:MAG: hypothetical protein JXA94_02410 [Parachlamydiales bacterium]|nr:hypothetical protein [Parachlamydiales bacterium]